MTHTAMPATAICAPTIERFRGQRSYWHNLLAQTGRGIEGTTIPQFSSNILISRVPSVGSNPTLSATFFSFSLIDLPHRALRVLAN